MALEHVSDESTQSLEGTFLEELGTASLPLGNRNSATSRRVTDFPAILPSSSRSSASVSL